MPIADSNAPPSSIAVVLGQARDALRGIGNPVDVLIGSAYLEGFAGKAPRVLFIPDKRGKVGPPIEMGSAVSMTHGCAVAVRATESGDDLTRLDAAYRLADLVIDLIGTAATGRVEWGDLADDSPLVTDAYGADLAFSFTYRRDIVHNAARRRLGPAIADVSPPRSAVHPEAIPGTEPTAFNATTQPQG